MPILLDGCDLTGAELSGATLTSGRLAGGRIDGLKGALALKGISIDRELMIPVALAIMQALEISIDDDPAG